VLRKGVIEQEGKPEEIYNRPATDFVGSLIGEPPMNLVDGEIITRNGAAWFKAHEDFSIQIRDDKVESLKKAAQQAGGSTVARLGIRCEHIRLSHQKLSDNSFQLPVYAIVHRSRKQRRHLRIKKLVLICEDPRGKGPS